MATLGLGLHESQPTLAEAAMQELRLISPHLRRAVTISRLIDDARSRATTFEMALDAAASAVILVDAELGIVHANGSGEVMLQHGDPVRSVAGMLSMRHELVPGQLRSAVSIASRAEAQLERRGIGIPTRLRDGSPLSIHVMPLRQRALRGGIGRATAGVFIAENGAPADLPPDAMSLLYGLTPAEMRVFELIVDGRRTEDIAETLGVAPSTLRTHLLHVFEKTGRHSRAELVKLSSEITLPG
jgi:DNA-binding CsgD family transcriptional regulator